MEYQEVQFRTLGRYPQRESPYMSTTQTTTWIQEQVDSEPKSKTLTQKSKHHSSGPQPNMLEKWKTEIQIPIQHRQDQMSLLRDTPKPRFLDIKFNT